MLVYFCQPPTQAKQFLLDSNFSDLNWICMSWSLLAGDCRYCVRQMPTLAILQRALLHAVCVGFCRRPQRLPVDVTKSGLNPSRDVKRKRNDSDANRNGTPTAAYVQAGDK